MDFLQRVDLEINKRGWSRNQLAIRAGLSNSYFSQLSKGIRQIGPDACRKIAVALRLPPDEVMRWAGIIEAPAPDPDYEEYNHKFKLLNPDKRKQAMEYLDFLLSKNEGE